jgi:VWA domain containing CoxE-like protein
MTSDSPDAPSSVRAALSDDDRDALLRWRLVLGPGAEEARAGLGFGALGARARAALGVDEGRLGALDRALGFPYDEERGADLSASAPYVPQWLSALREFFSSESIAMVQRDAIDRGLKQLLFEPETLPLLEKNVELVATLMAARSLVPERAKAIARQIVGEVVAEIRKRLESELRTAVFGALRRARHSPLKLARNLDWRRTVRANLRGWDAEHRRLVPERFYFWANQRRHHERDVVVLVDQSGSMATSVVYASIMAAIFASLDSLRTRLVAFDTEIADLTPLLDDPVEVLFSAQLGGGTDIERAVAYAQTQLIDRPSKTLLLLVTDLYEGGDARKLVTRLGQLVESGVQVLCMLALGEGGAPAHHEALAAELVALGVPCFACTPDRLAEVIEDALGGAGRAPRKGGR